MASNSTREQQALAQVMRADEEEAHREYWWRLLPSVDRRRALGLARLDPVRADNALSSFSIQERAIIHGALLGHIGRMEILMNCCGIAIERRPVVDHAGAVSRLAELEQQQEQTARRRQEFARLEQEQLQAPAAGRLH
jgi:hypothetical protein